MRIHLPRTTETPAGRRITYQLEYERPYGLPEELWYEVPHDSPPLNGRAEPALVALLPLAMSLPEPVQICGPASPRLLANLREWQSIFALWFPLWLHVVELQAELEIPAEKVGAGVASSFSGGLDSFYTVHANRDVLTHAILGGRMDVPGDAIYETLLREYRPLLTGMGVSLLTAKTNVRCLADRVTWEATHGVAIASLAHLFASTLSRFIFAASYTYDALFPWGSHPLADPLLSTEALQISHHGADRTRGQKVAAVCDWEPTFKALRVCWENPNGVQNCGHCGKCVRTMISLRLCGALERYETFPHNLSRAQVRSVRATRPNDWAFLTQNVEMARVAGNAELLADLEHAYHQSKIGEVMNLWRWRAGQLRRKVLRI